VYRREMRRTARSLLALAWLLLAAAPAAAATFSVNDTADAVDAAPGDGHCATAAGTCTLRAAVQEANARAGGDTIMVPAGTYLLTIEGRGEDMALTGDLDIRVDVTITGAGAASTVVDGNGTDRVFEIANSMAVVTISSLTIRNGDQGSVAGDTDGGGLYNSGTLTLTDVVVANNTASAGNGGGISSANDLTLTGCTVSGNTAANFGGGIDNPLTVTLTNVTVSGNTSGAGGGGGVANDLADAIATLTSVTIADNSAPAGSGGGFYNLGAATFRYVIVADSPSGDNCAGGGTSTSQGHNLDSGNTCGFTDPTDLVNVDPQLGPLQDNGGPTPTQALSTGSPAIDVGGDDCPPPLTDQRGFSRPADGNGDGNATCDIGAYEFGAAPPCAAGANFPSIDCRLGELIRTVQTVVPAGALRNGLGTILTRAKTQAGQAEQAMASGKRRREKALLARVNGSLGKFNARLRTRKAKKQIPGDALTAIKSAVGQLRHDVVMLRTSS
jgi:CSLREA domain-containing protein